MIPIFYTKNNIRKLKWDKKGTYIQLIAQKVPIVKSDLGCILIFHISHHVLIDAELLVDFGKYFFENYKIGSKQYAVLKLNSRWSI